MTVYFKNALMFANITMEIGASPQITRETLDLYDDTSSNNDLLY